MGQENNRDQPAELSAADRERARAARPAPRRSEPTRITVLMPYVMLAVGLLVAHHTAHDATPKWTRAHYGALFVVSGGVLLIARRWAGSWRAISVGITALLCLSGMVAWYWNDWCDETEWQFDREERVVVFYRDSKVRRNGHYFHRSMTLYEKPGDKTPAEFHQGPITADGRHSHGRWVLVHWVPMVASQVRWYWKGEEVSEREWRSRERAAKDR